PRALVLSEQSGTYAGNVHDFWRPLDRREAIVDGKYSVECYLDALAGAFMAYRGLERPPLVSGEALADRLVRFLYHTPFPKMAMKAHRRLLEVDGHAAGRAVEDDRAAARRGASRPRTSPANSSSRASRTSGASTRARERWRREPRHRRTGPRGRRPRPAGGGLRALRAHRARALRELHHRLVAPAAAA